MPSKNIQEGRKEKSSCRAKKPSGTTTSDTAQKKTAAAKADTAGSSAADLENMEKNLEESYQTGRADRAEITRMAQLEAAEAIARVGEALEADEKAEEAIRLSFMAEKSGNREGVKKAQKNERAARKEAKKQHKAATSSAKKAYDAIRFSAPNAMGFMRAVQALFAIHILTTLIYLMLMSRDAMTYDTTTVVDWIMVILESVAFWTFINRYKIGRPLVIGMAAFGIVVAVTTDLAAHNYNLFFILTDASFDIFLVFYFLFSRRVKATLVNDISTRSGDYEKDSFVIERHGWPFVRNLIVYFIVFSILGHWMEMGMCQFIRLGLVQGEYDPSNTMLWRDVLYPFPMEGAAVVVIALVLYPFYRWLREKFSDKIILAYIISFIAGALLCTAIEFGMGLVVNDHYQLWDYRENFANILGQVCLQNTAAFGVVAAIITWWVYPLLERWIARIPQDIMNIASIIIMVFGAIIWSLYLITPPAELDSLEEESGQATEVSQEAGSDQEASSSPEANAGSGATVNQRVCQG